MHYYLIGIKGSGMCALASILKQQGNIVNGSDVEHVYFTDEKLHQNNIPVLPFDPSNLTKDIDEVIIGNAFSDDHPEVIAAKKLGIKCTRYYDFIQENLVNKYNSIAICGTNGKTTTTGLTKSLLREDDSVVLIGDGTGSSGKAPRYFIFEACEYKNTFLNYTPDICLITNVEMDHPDFFKNIEQMVESYQQFANQSDKIIINADDSNCQKIMHKNITTFGVNNDQADINLELINSDESGFDFNITYNGKKSAMFHLPFFGMHMVYNALAAISVGIVLGFDLGQIIKNITTFNGVSRRFNVTNINQDRDIFIIDDYAHHPTSIRLTLEAIRQKFPDYTLTCIFQAHTYSRVANFHKEFAESLSLADFVMVDEIFGSIREKNQIISKNMIIDDLNDLGVDIIDDIEALQTIPDKHVIAILGAGDIDTYMIPKVKKLLGE